MIARKRKHNGIQEMTPDMEIPYRLKALLNEYKRRYGKL